MTGGQGPNTIPRKILATGRNTWRGLTSMRTALILLFLLAVAALPGALLPQRNLNRSNVADYIATHGWWGRLLDQLQFFDIYSSVWFSAIYLLLLISLVGCLLPRSLDYLRQIRAQPVRTPRNLNRLPHHARSTTEATPEQVTAMARETLTGWRLAEREEPSGARSISAERGFLREAGNLVFHFAVLGLVVAFAVGKMFSYEGNVVVMADGSQFCNSGVYAYDSFHPGLTVDGTGLNPFCIKVNDFTPEFLPNGQAEQYTADIEYQSGADLAAGNWQPYQLRVNEPLRTAGDRLYLLDHGYAPVFTVTFPNGATRTKSIQWKPVDQQTLLSQGATKFDRPGVTDPQRQRETQLAITGLFAPTAAFRGKVLDSSFPELRNPAAAIDVMKGDLGTDSGQGQSIFEVDQSMVDSGRLERVARENIRPGQQITIDDGTKIRFDGVQRWVALQVSHNPTQMWVLGFAVALLIGLGVSLTVKRRRLWVRVTPPGGESENNRTVVEVGGLARTDQAGYGEEFARISGRLLERAADDPRVSR